MKNFSILIPSLIALSSVARAEVITKTFDAAGIHRVEVRNASGKIDVTGTDEAKATVAANETTFPKTCVLNVEQTGDKLVVEIKTEAVFTPSKCEVDFDLKVPHKVAIELKNGSGPVQIKAVAGDIDFKVGSGTVDIDGDIGTLAGKTGSGPVRVTGTVAKAVMQGGSSAMTFTYRKKPENGSLDIKTGSGNTVVYLPTDTKVQTTFKSGSGQFTNEIGDAPNAAFTISAKAGSGDLAIKKAL